VPWPDLAAKEKDVGEVEYVFGTLDTRKGTKWRPENYASSKNTGTSSVVLELAEIVGRRKRSGGRMYLT
jgi:hypothetical protein